MGKNTELSELPSQQDTDETYMEVPTIQSLTARIHHPNYTVDFLARIWYMILNHTFPVARGYSIGPFRTGLTNNCPDAAVITVNDEDHTQRLFLVMDATETENYDKSRWASFELLLRADLADMGIEDIYLAIAVGNLVKFYRWHSSIGEMSGYGMNSGGEPFHIGRQCRFVTETLLDIQGLSWTDHMASAVARNDEPEME